MTMSELEHMLKLIHREVSRDITERMAGRRHYMIRGLYRYCTVSHGRERIIGTLDESVVLTDSDAANGGTP